MLMTTDPGRPGPRSDLRFRHDSLRRRAVGRRWITIDTSRVALALARQRIMGAKFPYYMLADPNGDMRKGFVYETSSAHHAQVDRKQSGHQAWDELSEEIDAAIARHAESETPLRPARRGHARKSASLVRSPSRVCRRIPQSPRSVPNPRRRQPRTTGRLSRRASSTTFLRPGSRTGGRPSGCCSSRWSRSPGSASRPRASSGDTQQRIAVSIGPQFGTVDPEWIRLAAREATRGLGFDVLLVCAFAFDPQAMKATEEFSIGRVRVCSSG